MGQAHGLSPWAIAHLSKTAHEKPPPKNSPNRGWGEEEDSTLPGERPKPRGIGGDAVI
jgi:hypothetical protein